MNCVAKMQGQPCPECDIPRKKWTPEEEESLRELYEGHGTKGDLPVRVIAQHLGRTVAACRSKLSRLYSASVSRQWPLPAETDPENTNQRASG